ncbi:MAG TPA: phosphohydrolase [Ruminococcus sp.]|nr:phosphohydrolase [Ruminococcus sp.]
MKNTGKVIEAMIEYYGTDLRRINHFLKVFSFTKTIGEGESLDTDSQNLLEVSAIVHDIGIKQSELKYNSSAGKYQELEGPAEAEKLLSNLGYDSDFIDKVCYLVGHHHTYSQIDSMPYRILVEADFLVNLYEDGAGINAVKKAEEKIFRTPTGIKLLKKMYFGE